MMIFTGDGVGDGFLPVSQVLGVTLVVVSSVVLAVFLSRSAARSSLRPAPSKEESLCSAGILDSMSQTCRLRLQSRVANAKSAEDLYLIFDDFDVLHRLELRIDPSHTGASPAQAYRDLVRDKVNINSESVLVTEEQARSPVSFQLFFHGLALGVVRELNASSLALVHEQEQAGQQSLQARSSFSAVSQASRSLDEDRLATHLCCHLARTRAGGDSFFCVSHIFNSPQVMSR